MNSTDRQARQSVRIGIVLALIVALFAFFARSAGAQDTVPVRLSLGEAARLAAKQSGLAEAAELRARQGEARVRERRADLLPNLSTNFSQLSRTLNTASFGIEFPSPPGSPPVFDPNGQVLGPVGLIDVRGRLSSNLLDYAAIQRVRGAQTQVTALDADASNQAEQAAAVAAGAYLRAVQGDARLKARLADSVLASELLSISQDLLKSGVGVKLDVTRAQSQLSLVRSQLIATRNDRDRARLDLLRALNLPANTDLTLTDSLGSLPAAETPESEQSAIDVAMHTRQDVRALDAQVHASQQQTAAIKAERLPTLGVFGDDGAIGKEYGHLLNTYQIGFQVSLPVFDGFRREARIQEQSLQTQELKVRRRDLELSVGTEVRQAMLDLTSAQQQVAAAQERIGLAEQELEQARDRFRAGVASNSDVITAQLSLNTARTQLVDATTAYQVGRIGLARAQGSVTTLR